MRSHPWAAFFAAAALGAQAQALPPGLARSLDTVIVTASRTVGPSVSTLRDAVIVSREDLEAHSGLSLAEVLQRVAGVEFRTSGGPGQPTGLFIRGAGSAQTLVLVDGLRVGSATAGTTSVESIPIEMIERIEVVKGPMSSLYGSEAIGGVVNIVTRGKGIPHLFASAAYGSHDDRRVAAGLATAEGPTRASLSAGLREIDAPSATHAGALFGVHHPDRDPHENAFVTLRASHRLWQGEEVGLEAFTSRSRTAFDGGHPADRSRQVLAGGRITSSIEFTPGWTSRLAFGHGRDEIEFQGGFPARFETRQNQASWINEIVGSGPGSLVLGAETVRQRIAPGEAVEGGPLFAQTRRVTNSAFASLNQSWGSHQLEASGRHDRDDQFGERNTGSASYGMELAPRLRLAVTLSRGFRAPTFNDLYLSFPGYEPNPALRPEESRSTEVSLRGSAGKALSRWRITAYDNRLQDLIVATAQGVMNVDRARVRGVEASAEGEWLGVRWRGQITLQRPRDERTGLRLQHRAERFGALELSRAFGRWTVAGTVVASGERFDSIGEAPESRLPGYATADVRVRYAFPKYWSVELAAINVGDRRYESVRGFEAPGRSVLLTVRFDAF